MKSVVRRYSKQSQISRIDRIITIPTLCQSKNIPDYYFVRRYEKTFLIGRKRFVLEKRQATRLVRQAVNSGFTIGDHTVARLHTYGRVIYLHICRYMCIYTHTHAHIYIYIERPRLALNAKTDLRYYKGWKWLLKIVRARKADRWRCVAHMYIEKNSIGTMQNAKREMKVLKCLCVCVYGSV